MNRGPQYKTQNIGIILIIGTQKEAPKNSDFVWVSVRVLGIQVWVSDLKFRAWASRVNLVWGFEFIQAEVLKLGGRVLGFRA